MVKDHQRTNPKKKVAIVTCAVLVLIGSAVWLLQDGPVDQVPELTYFYDLTSGELFPADRTSEPPIDAPSGVGKGVRAVVYSCGSCSKGEQKIAFLVTYSEAARLAMNAMSDGNPAAISQQNLEAIQNGTLLAQLPESNGELRWVPESSSEAGRIRKEAAEACGGKPVVTCYPQ